jgi:hypothetical protein
MELWFLFVWIPFVSSVVSAGFPFVVKVEALPPLWRESVVFGEAQCEICCHVLCVSWVEHWNLYIGGLPLLKMKKSLAPFPYLLQVMAFNRLHNFSLSLYSL